MLSIPAGPNRHKSGQNRVFKTIISGQCLKRLSYLKSSHWCNHLEFAQNLLGPQNMGSFILIVLKSYSYRDSDIGNLRKIKYFCDYFRPSHKT